MIASMSIGKTFAALVALGVAGGIGYLVYDRIGEAGEPSPGRRGQVERVAPVEAAPVTRGAIERRREFTGTLTAFEEFVVAPKVSGRIEEVTVDLADTVRRGQVVARLDNAEYVQELAQAEADLEVARANVSEAESLLAIANRELERVRTLVARGVSSDAELDSARSNQLARAAHVEVTRAQEVRARASVEAARIRLGYTEVAADWRGGHDERVVAERFVNEGETVAANAPLLRIVELEPMSAEFFVTERDYAMMKTGQGVDIATDAYPGETFTAEIARISPVFLASARQARVRLEVDNPDMRLKPGMFMRASVLIERVDDALIVPEQALVIREGQTGVFQVARERDRVAWREVETGIRDGERVQIVGGEIGGLVVTLGQQLLDDGSRVSVVEGDGE